MDTLKPSELASKALHLEANVWRCTAPSTGKTLAKLVDTANEAEILEKLLAPKQATDHLASSIHPLISEPFAYGPWVNKASRFRPVGGYGVFYSAFEVETALVEQAWHRRQFLNDYESGSEIKGLSLQVFSVAVSGSFIDAAHESLAAQREALLDPMNYEASQIFANQAKEAGLEGIKYQSVRHTGGECLAVLKQAAIIGQPSNVDNRWWLSFSKNRASFIHDRIIGSGKSFTYQLH